MSGTACQLCQKPTAAYCCQCSSKALFFCHLCLSSHTTHSAPHLFFPLSTVPPASPLCEVCGVLPAQEICSCEFPLISYCAACKICHLAQAKSTASHIFLPLIQRPLIHSAEELAKTAKSRLETVLAYEKVQRNIDAIERCENAVKNRCASIKVALEQFVEQKKAAFAGFIRTIRGKIDAGMRDAKVLLTGRSSGHTEGVMGLIADYLRTKDKDKLLLVRSDEVQKDVKMEDVYGLEWESRVNAEGLVVSDEFSLKKKTQIGLIPISEGPNPLDFPSLESFQAACHPLIPISQIQVRYYQAHFNVLQAFRISHKDTLRSMNIDRPEGFWTSQGVCQLLQRTQGQAPSSVQLSLSHALSQDYSTLMETTDLHRRNSDLQALVAAGQLRGEIGAIRPKRGRKFEESECVKRFKTLVPSPPSDLEDLLDKD